jgi:hypothetical protein
MGEAGGPSLTDLAASDIVRSSRICEASLNRIATPAWRLRRRAEASQRTQRKRLRVFGACVFPQRLTGVNNCRLRHCGTRGVKRCTATNVVQIVISGTTRRAPEGVISMPAFGNAYSDTEIAAVTNYVTVRFGVQSDITAKDVAKLRSQRAR